MGKMSSFLFFFLQTLRELSVMNATLLRRLDELALLARPVREVHNVTEEEEEEEAEDGVRTAFFP